MNTDQNELAQLRAEMEKLAYPYDTLAIKRKVDAVFENELKTTFDQDFVDFCKDCVNRRVRRLERLTELSAPEFIMKGEFQWLVRNLERLELGLSGKDWVLSSDEKKDLQQQMEIDKLFEEESSENKENSDG